MSFPPSPAPISVGLNQIIQDPKFHDIQDDGDVPVAMGVKIDGQPLIPALSGLPHMLVSGTSGIYARSSLERAFRDIHTVRHHGWVSESRYGTYSQVILGLDPDFPLATFGAAADGE